MIRNDTGGGYRADIPHGLMFHRFHASPDADEWQGAHSPEELEKIIQYVGVERLLTPEEWLRRLGSDILEPQDLCITFDDGLRSQLDHALPVLDRLGLKAFWFVCSTTVDGGLIRSETYSYVAGRSCGMSSMIEEFLRRAPDVMLDQLDGPAFSEYSARMHRTVPFYTDDDIKYRFLRNLPDADGAFVRLMDEIVEGRGFDLRTVAGELWLSAADLKRLASEGHEIGLHSYNHPHEMARLSRAEQQEEYGANQAHLLTVTGKRPTTMSHPLNSYNDDSLAVLEELGISCGFRANMLDARGQGVNPSSLEIAREDSATLLALIL